MRQLSKVDHMVRSLDRLLSKNIALLNKRIKQLEKLRSEFDDLYEVVHLEVEHAREIQREYEETIEALNSKCKVLEEATIPTLVDQHKLLHEIYKTDIAAAVSRQVALTMKAEQ